MPKSDSNKSIRIGTRATKLAIRQAEILSQEIINKKIAKIDNIEIIPIKSSGDYVSASIGPYDGKLLFTKEIDQALIDKRIDIAAHSVKDLESNLTLGQSPADILINKFNTKWDQDINNIYSENIF